jgi:hypothetical protein
MIQHRLTLVGAVMLTLAPAAAGRAGAEETRREGRPRPLRVSSAAPLRGVLAPSVDSDSPDCGANSLYVFLRLHGVERSLEAIRNEVRVTAQGASMLELKEAAGRNGLDAAVLNTSPAELFGRLPAIARLSADGSAEKGHYVVVTRADETLVHLIDGTTGLSNRVARTAFEREFSGYALARRGGQRASVWGLRNVCLAGLGVAQAGALALLGLRGWRARRPA